MQRILREISGEQYRIRREKYKYTQEIITQNLNGIEHSYKVSEFQCDKCKRYFEYRNDLGAAFYTYWRHNLRRFCIPCWNTEKYQITEKCIKCGCTVQLLELCGEYCREAVGLRSIKDVRRNMKNIV